MHLHLLPLFRTGRLIRRKTVFSPGLASVAGTHSFGHPSFQRSRGLSSQAHASSQPSAESAVQLGLYEHSATGKRYEVTDVCRHTGTLDEMIVYRALQDDYGTWVRPKGEFFEILNREGKSFPRFKFIRQLHSKPPIIDTQKKTLKPVV